MSAESTDRSSRGRWQRRAALLPLAALSLSWTVAVADAGPSDSLLAVERDVPEAPAVAVAVPRRSVPTPASVQSGRAVPIRPAVRAVVAPSGRDIPAVALAAYQRSEAIIEGADVECRLTWPLLAAIGKVESDHGRVGGGQLDADGVARPRVVGIPLNGKSGTALISDTDAGALDGDRRFDRAVGPMQFIPSTWGVVGVDADGDGQRNIQDIDDAALAAAVYLCSGSGSLATPAGVKAGLHRYNRSSSYVRQVIRIMREYAASGAVTLAAGMTVPVGVVPQRSEGPSASGRTGPQHLSSADKNIDREADQEGGRDEGAAPVEGDGAKEPREPEPQPKPQPVPALLQPVTGLLTRAQAILECTLKGLTALLEPTAFERCIDELTE